MFTVNVTDEFTAWFKALSKRNQDRISGAILLLEEQGPALGRPVVDSIKSSKHPMKELRQGSMRVLFVFDPKREALLLVGGDKQNRWKQWYREAIPKADAIYDKHLAALKRAASKGTKKTQQPKNRRR